MIKSSRHTVKFANKNKRIKLNLFLDEYRRIAQLYIDRLWNNKIVWKNKILDISNQQYQVPQFISTKDIPIITNLSARALKCCSTQACGMVSAALKKQSKRIYKLKQLQSENKNITKLQNKITNTKLIKPNARNIKAELNSICCDLQKNKNSFDAFLQLKSIGKTYNKVRIPIKYHRHSNKLSDKSKQLNSFLISKNEINIRYEFSKISKKTNGLILGADQGIKTVLTLSSGQTTPPQNNHGHTLDSITHKLARKRKGSKAFHKVQDHRENFINWSINNLNFKNIKQINLENIINIGYKNKRSRYLSHFANTLIRDKLLDICENIGVQVVFQSSIYRSQRCSGCGLVRKANRKSKKYICKNCGLEIDADLNAARNHEQQLPNIPFAFRKLNLNQKGFFWKPEGFYDLTGVALTVPLSMK